MKTYDEYIQQGIRLEDRLIRNEQALTYYRPGILKRILFKSYYAMRIKLINYRLSKREIKRRIIAIENDEMLTERKHCKCELEILKDYEQLIAIRRIINS